MAIASFVFCVPVSFHCNSEKYFYILDHQHDSHLSRYLGDGGNRFLRMTIAPVCENGLWRIRYNNKLIDIFSEADIVLFFLDRVEPSPPLLMPLIGLLY
jgi:hypothetical protein